MTRCSRGGTCELGALPRLSTRGALGNCMILLLLVLMLLGGVCSHDAGVCSMQCNTHQEYCLATGRYVCGWCSWGLLVTHSPLLSLSVLLLISYDETVRIWDTRKIRRPIETLRVGGGVRRRKKDKPKKSDVLLHSLYCHTQKVWRLKWSPAAHQKQLLLAGCMHNGFHVLEYSDKQGMLFFVCVSCCALSSGCGGRLRLCLLRAPSTTELSTRCSYMKHTDLAYGCDWVYAVANATAALTASSTAQSDNDRIVSCSFYDHQLHLWQPELQQPSS